MKQNTVSSNIAYSPVATAPPVVLQAENDKALLDDYKKVYGAVKHGGEEIMVARDISLYDALERMHLLVRPSFPKGLGWNLIQEGELGLAMLNGSPKFLSPGRHTLWSPLNSMVEVVSITKKLIEIGPIQVVTINQGELGLSLRNGETILLDPGRFILRAPHTFVKSTAANGQYIELGTYRRISVPAGFVAIAFDKGKQIVIRPEDTKDGPFETSSATFLFDPRQGFQSTQLQVKELDEIKVNTRDGVTISARGLISYQIHDPRAAFMAVSDVNGAVKRAAEACLTGLFLNASIDEIAPSIPTHPNANVDEKQKRPLVAEKMEPYQPERADFSRHVREAFLHDFSRTVHSWGVDLRDLTLEKLEFDQSVKELLRKRAQARLETSTNLAILTTQTEVALQQSDRERRQVVIAAEAQANATRLKADADFYMAERRAAAAKLLSEVPLAAQLEMRRLDVEVVKATGDKTTFLPLGVSVDNYALPGKNGQLFMASAVQQPRSGVQQAS